MKRIILHWTGGTHSVSDLDRQHYHFIIDGEGNVHDGIHPVRANEDTSDGDYAAHTRHCNTGSIGVAVAAMHRAKEHPFTPGKYPITDAQVDALALVCSQLCRAFHIPVTRTTVLTHAEVQPTLGIVQRGKWDITWLPGMQGVEAPVAVGDRLRGLIKAKLAPRTPKPTQTPPTGRTAPRAAAPVSIAVGLAAAAWAIWEGIKAFFGG